MANVTKRRLSLIEVFYYNRPGNFHQQVTVADEVADFVLSEVSEKQEN